MRDSLHRPYIEYRQNHSWLTLVGRVLTNKWRLDWKAREIPIGCSLKADFCTMPLPMIVVAYLLMHFYSRLKSIDIVFQGTNR